TNSFHILTLSAPAGVARKAGLLVLVLLLGPTHAGAQSSLPADVSIQLADSPDPVAMGGTLTHTITVTNGGPGVATSVQVVDDLNFFNLTLMSAPPECSGGFPTVTCSIGELAPGASATLTLLFIANDPPGSVIGVSASVTAAEADPDPSNNGVAVE